MYGVPVDLDLTRFISASLDSVCLGEFHLHSGFASSAPGSATGPSISVEGSWELRDAAGSLADRSVPNATREAYRLHRLLGREVVAAALDAPRSFSLLFDDGHRLVVFDDSTDYESFSIQPGDVVV